MSTGQPSATGKIMNKFGQLNKKWLPLVILGCLLLIAYLFFNNPPEAERRAAPTGPKLTVETLSLGTRPYQVWLESYGIVQPRTQSMLVAQVGGQIQSISPRFRAGGFFEAGDLLLSIDPRDYEADVKIAEATLMDARQALAEEQARSEQALADWKRLGNKGDAPELVLRKPQLLAAQARVISSQSGLTKAQLELERTQIRAPFAGRILSTLVDVGQVVSNNTQLAEIYATDYLEIRLPLRNRDLQFIDLPELYRFDSPASMQNTGELETAAASGRDDGVKVQIQSELSASEPWSGNIVRTESAIDTNARQLHVVAQINDPYGEIAIGRTPLKIGEYVTARIKAKLLADAMIIPNSAIYQGSYVYIVEDDLLRRREIDIAWQNSTDALISAGLQAGDQLVMTSLGQVTSGIRVKARPIENPAILPETIPAPLPATMPAKTPDSAEPIPTASQTGNPQQNQDSDQDHGDRSTGTPS